MTDFATLFQQGNGWFFIPSAILLGALHGLEPGHSKTMMAAFIVAIKGTVKQAVMLGLAATLSHTAVVWLIAMGGMFISRRFTAAAVEPWMQMISAVIILGTAAWMFWRTWQGERQWHAGHHHDHHHGHDHHHDHPHPHPHAQGLIFQPAQAASLSLRQPVILSARKVEKQEEYRDAHELAHARDIERRFNGTKVTNGQILLFGLTGGLIPCPAAITVLLICIQLKALTLGATMVVCFSIGLALTLVAVGVGAAVSVQHAAKRWSGFNTLARRAPYFSSVLIALVGVYMGVHGYFTLR
ncbi:MULTISPECIES: nickel/cobalt efflux protein RcnA [Phytobacter]|uniref:Nickel/cobalt efflux system n=1 Tax=Phytobacter diazotrophicus TaxID=395631 RepID=A0ABN6LLC5_9ENTR|nr:MULTISPECIES: nickel/cobalt efflux protein RcnA [Phytobacter]MDU4150274.1 nickel/cobalt efflux protein RcnA [Enterobacteriaceae bacterium]MDU7377395.1 nickel/cobalt efflux protein RcnA [Enterobacteriaceae bacterium]BBE76296.1 nickel/cobalt efflux system RcnA [Phytobacter sp. MRY16-398]BDD49767.1 nickel/cobalt efflux system RcnA [Phytobacter diazotrophicus]BEG80798.1 nickel/cobalt efflux protein RcnA [Phytobacter diazotrophicus]